MTPAWLGVKALQSRFGGLIGRDTIIRLMKAQHIRSCWIGRALATTENDLEDFESRILEANAPLEFKDDFGDVILSIAPGVIGGLASVTTKKKRPENGNSQSAQENSITHKHRKQR